MWLLRVMFSQGSDLMQTGISFFSDMSAHYRLTSVSTNIWKTKYWSTSSSLKYLCIILSRNFVFFNYKDIILKFTFCIRLCVVLSICLPKFMILTKFQRSLRRHKKLWYRNMKYKSNIITINYYATIRTMWVSHIDDSVRVFVQGG